VTNCSCSSYVEIIKDQKLIAILKKEKFSLLKADGKKWMSLYHCPECGTYWEEHYIDDRWDGWPELYKVTPSHVESVWGKEYLN
jgi:hypothetical protein